MVSVDFANGVDSRLRYVSPVLLLQLDALTSWASSFNDASKKARAAATRCGYGFSI